MKKTSGRLALAAAIWLVSAAPVLAQTFAAPGDRIALGAPKQTPRTSIERGLRERIQGFLSSSDDPWKITSLLVVGTLYGVIHALGPGHQKTLLGGYFLSQDASLGTVALAAAVTAAMHASSVLLIFGGFALAACSIRDMDRARFLVTRGSGFALFAVATLIAYRRIRAALSRLKPFFTKAGKYSQVHDHHHSHDDGDEHLHTADTTCAACERIENLRTSGVSYWTVVLAGGLVPCPGAAFLLLLGVSTGNVGTGIAAVLAISFGMAVTLFAVAAGARAARGTVTRSAAQKNQARALWISALDLVGAALMVGFAAVLLF